MRGPLPLLLRTKSPGLYCFMFSIVTLFPKHKVPAFASQLHRETELYDA